MQVFAYAGAHKTKGTNRKRHFLLVNLIFALSGMAFAANPSLIFSTYLGGSSLDVVNAVAVDGSGNLYLAGFTASSDFPGVSGSSFQPGNAGGTDAFVSKFDSSGTLLWSTYLGGNGIDIANSIAVDGFGIVHITGSTTSTNFPVLNPYQAANAGGTDVFVAAINSTGTALIYSTYLGCPGEDAGNGIAVDSAGNAFVTGFTTADSAPFPVKSAFQSIAGGAQDAFVSKFSPSGGLVYSTYLGGTTADIGRAIAIDSAGNAYITGHATDAFPIVAATAFKATITGPGDAFISKISPDGATLLYSTYLGGSNDDDAFGIALDGADNVYITGYTGSADFPTTVVLFANRVGQLTISTAPDAFVFKLNMNIPGYLGGVYSTYLGGSADDRAYAIKVDAAGNAYVAGRTTSTDFPLVNPILGTNGGTGMVFVTELGPPGDTKLFSTYLGGTTDQQGNGIGLDSARNIYVAGWTNSTNFPVSNAFQGTNGGAQDGFLAKISAPSPQAETPAITPAAGSYIGSVTITISTGTSGATIRYTTDGTAPLITSTEYTSAFTWTLSATVKAAAFKGGWADSVASSCVYTILPEILGVTIRSQDDTTQYAGWPIGTVRENTECIMDGTNCVLVKNEGNVTEDFSVVAACTKWSFGSPVGIDVCTVMALFNGNSAPGPSDFSAVDLVTIAPKWSTSSSGSGIFEGTRNGSNILYNAGEKLYMYLKTPSAITSATEETITITVGCRKH